MISARILSVALGLALALAALSGGTRALAAGTARVAQIAHGRYLVENVAMCGECHTPRGPDHRPIHSRWLGGAWLRFGPKRSGAHWAAYAPALAGLAGLPGWSAPEWTAFLETGKTPSGVPPRPPMPAYRMSQSDAAAVLAYLKSLGAPASEKSVRSKDGAARLR